MASDTFSFKPSDEQREWILQYQQDRGSPDDPMKKSDALRELVNAGLQRHYGGLRDTFFLELAKVTLGVALAVTVLWAMTDLGALEFPSYLFWGVSLGSTAVHYSPYNPVSALFGRSKHAS